jgi:hypothetical protein
MTFLGDIWGIVKNVTGLAYSWFTGYGSKENQQARVKTDENQQLDKLHEDIKKRDLDSVRRDLSR